MVLHLALTMAAAAAPEHLRVVLAAQDQVTTVELLAP